MRHPGRSQGHLIETRRFSEQVSHRLFCFLYEKERPFEKVLQTGFLDVVVGLLIGNF
jgi:hypothetical protein